MAGSMFKKGRDNKNIDKLLRSTFADPNLLLDKKFIEYFYETTDSSHNLLFISMMISSLKNLLLTSELGKIKNDTLIIWGEKDKTLPLRKNKDNFSLIPNSKVKIIKNGGHIVSIEKSKEFNSIVLDFLK